MCGGRDQPAGRAECRTVFLRGVEMTGRGRWADGGPRGLVAGRAQDRHRAGRVRAGRGHEGVLTEEDGEVRTCGGLRWCGLAAGAEGNGDAGGCPAREGGACLGAGSRTRCPRACRFLRSPRAFSLGPASSAPPSSLSRLPWMGRPRASCPKSAASSSSARADACRGSSRTCTFAFSFPWGGSWRPPAGRGLRRCPAQRGKKKARIARAIFLSRRLSKTGGRVDRGRGVRGRVT